MSLVSRLFEPAVHFFRRCRETGTQPILIGGAAIILNGRRERKTKDLDLNMLPEKEPDQVKATYLHPTYAIKFDLRVSRPTPSMPFMKEYHGIVYANKQLLLATTFSTIHAGRPDSKISTAKNDAEWLIGELEREGKQVPNELKEYFGITDAILEPFVGMYGEDDREIIEEIVNLNLLKSESGRSS